MRNKIRSIACMEVRNKRSPRSTSRQESSSSNASNSNRNGKLWSNRLKSIPSWNSKHATSTRIIIRFIVWTSSFMVWNSWPNCNAICKVIFPCLASIFDLFFVVECRQFCKQGDLNRAKTLFQSIESVTQDPYLFPSSVDRSSQDQYSFYETFQRSIRQLRSDITQMHTTLWNDGVDRQLKNEVKVTSNYLDRLFQCTFYEDKGEKSLIEKHVQTFATYCLQGFIHRLIEKRSELTIEDDERTLRLVYSLDSDQESSGNHRIEQFDRALNYLREFFQALHTNLLSRTVKIQPANQKWVN